MEVYPVKMTILGVFLFNQIRTGGDRRYLELMEGLAERGNTVFVIINTLLDYKSVHFRKIELSIKYKYRKFPPSSFLFRESIKKNLDIIKKSIKEHNAADIDWIHIHGDTSLKASIYLKKVLSLPLFYAFRCNDIDRAHILRASGNFALKKYLFSLIYEPINRSREKQVARYAELVTFQNSIDRDRFLERTGCGKQKTIVIPGNIGLPRCAPEWENKNQSSKVRNIVYIGSLSGAKGLWDVLKALGVLKKRGHDLLRCSILGRKENMDTTLRLIDEMEIEKMVSIEGYQDPFPYLVSSDLLVYPSLYDAYPDTILEALHTGCPVIASRVGGIPDLLAHLDLLFESGRVGEIADRIERCIKDEAFYAHIRKLCAERAEAHRFDWAGKFVEAMEDRKGR
ncbi:hypothetical protein FACS189498_2610 [Spirochaetia bacterium]|nr:hypothetical protein FACS189498_2610 [Spirochaetia bacterium]